MDIDLKKLKNNSKNKIILLVLTLIMSLGLSLAAIYFVNIFNDERENILKTGLVSINYIEGTENIFLDNQVPVIDDVGLTNTPYEFTVKNTSKVPINVKLEIISQNNNQIPLGAVRYGLYINDELVKKDSLGALENNTFYLLENVQANTVINAKLIFWVDYYYETPGQTFSAKLKVSGESFDIIYEEVAVELLKTKLGTGGLVAIDSNGDSYNSNTISDEIREYRYSGLPVNNYVFFDTNGNGNKEENEVWRIVGIFKDTIKDEDGNVVLDVEGNQTYEEKVKLVRNTTLQGTEMPTSYLINGTNYSIKASDVFGYWNYIESGTYPSNQSDWTRAGMQYFLNTEKDESETPNVGYLSSFTNEAKKIISPTTYFLGNIYESYTTKLAFSEERKMVECSSSLTSNSHNNNCNIWSGNRASWNGLVALMYPSDYGYSVDNGTLIDKQMNDVSDFAYNARRASWIFNMPQHNTYSEWFISPSVISSQSITEIYTSATLTNNYSTYHRRAIRPVLHLKSGAIIKDAQGTEKDPYVVVIE